MKKMILGLAALVMVTCTFAQQGEHRGKGMRHGVENRQGNGLRDLNLTDAQKQQVKKINEDFHQQMQTLKSKENITVKEQNDQRAAIIKAHKANLDAVLTPEQQQQVAKSKDENQQKRAEMAETRLDKMKEKLNLSDAQVASIKSSQQTTNNKIDVIMKDESLDQADKKQQIMSLRQEMKTDMAKVLTPEQKSKLEAFKKENHEKMKSHKGHRMQTGAVK